MNPLPSRLLAVTDRHQAKIPLPEAVETLIGSGLRWLWFRDRDLATAERRAMAERLCGLARAAGATLTIGADIDLAEAVGAGGIQLRDPSQIGAARQCLGDEALIGVSAHSLADIAEAKAAGADYATLSPIFASLSKPGYGPALGPAALTEAARIGLPVLALGGITSDNAPSCLAAGASGVAVMGALMRNGADDLADLIAIIRRS